MVAILHRQNLSLIQKDKKIIGLKRASRQIRDALFGTSPLDITINALGDAYGDPLDADLYSGGVNVVPEPATILLVASGLVGLGFLRRKRALKKSLDV